MSVERTHGDQDELIAPLADAGAVTVAVMVTSADGHATVGGHVGGLTGEADQEVLLGVRELADAVVVGATTVRVEGYEGLLDEPARARRRERGLPEEPELIVATRMAGALPKGARAVTAPVDADGHPDFAPVWREIRAQHHGLIACEGGPTLLGQLLRLRLVDQLVLGISPMLVGGGDEKRLLDHTEELGLALEVLAVRVAGDFVFVRYGARGEATAAGQGADHSGG
ncbi:MAG TPA: dihydrofolate reductase family protein [Solirubrobacteraceae bacterium]|nr:dihydrofolate reductase family protein [Solirubrobacteraceae bacterium]